MIWDRIYCLSFMYATTSRHKVHYYSTLSCVFTITPKYGLDIIRVRWPPVVCWNQISRSVLFQHCRAEHTLTSWWSNNPTFLSLYKGNKDRKKQDTAYPSSSFSICDIFSIRWDENFCVSKVSFGSKWRLWYTAMAYWQKDVPQNTDMNIRANTDAIIITIPCTYS